MLAIYVMWLRQLKRHFRSKSRLFASLGQPILFLVALGFGFGPIYAQAGGGSYLQFLTPGVISMSIMFSAMFSGIEVIVDKQFGFLKETLAAPISRHAIMIGRTFGGATVAVFQGFAVFLIALIFGFRPETIFGVVIALVFMVVIALFFTVLGTAFATLFEDTHAFPIIMNFVMMPLFFLSGALFPLKDAPKVLEIIAKFNPLTYGVDGLRGSLIGEMHFGLLSDFSILAIVMVAFLFLGGYLFSRVEV